jgi:hypothetical protein
MAQTLNSPFRGKLSDLLPDEFFSIPHLLFSEPKLLIPLKAEKRSIKVFAQGSNNMMTIQ